MPIPPFTPTRHNPVPLYYQVAQHIRGAISGGALTSGERIPNELDLAERFGMSRPTMRQALSELVSEGLLVRRRGVGTIVTPDEIHRHVELTSLYEDLAASGRKPSTKVLDLELELPPESVATAMRTGADDPLLRVDRVRYSRGTPLALMRNWLPVSLGELTVSELEKHGLYAVMRARGQRPTAARQYISARSAGQREARHLEVRRNSPLLSVRRTAYDAHGVPLEYGDHFYRSDDYAVEVFTSET